GTRADGRGRVPARPVRGGAGSLRASRGRAMSLPEISYGDFGARLSRAGGAARVPLSGSIEITFKCNLRCVHCYVPDYSGWGEMTRAEHSALLGAGGGGC